MPRPLQKGDAHGAAVLDLPGRRGGHRRPLPDCPLGGAAIRQRAPYGTLIVNLAGCFAIPSLMHAAMTLGWSPTLRSALTIGFVGGFTTYSSFNYETTRLFEEGSVIAGGTNVVLTLLGGFMAGWLGLLCARELVGP